MISMSNLESDNSCQICSRVSSKYNISPKKCGVEEVNGCINENTQVKYVV